MRIVEMTRDMRPYAKGQDAVLPDDVAAKLLQEGDAKNPRPFPPPDVAPKNRVATQIPPVKSSYMTRNKRRN